MTAQASVSEDLTIRVAGTSGLVTVEGLAPVVVGWPEDLTARGLAERVASASPGMPADLASIVATASADPAGLASRLGAPLDTARTRDGDLLSLTTRVLTPMLFPGPQPRGRSRAAAAGEPVVARGEEGEVEIVFANWAAATEWLIAALTRTLAVGSHRIPQVAATGVLCDLDVHPARLVLTDEGLALPVLLVRDGITRLAATWALLWESDGEDPRQTAEAIARNLLPQQAPTPAQWTRSRTRLVDAARQVLVRSAAEGGKPGWAAIRVRQGLTVPAKMLLGLADSSGPAGSFDRALRAVVAAQHIDVAPWSDEDQTLDTMLRAIQSLRDADLVSAAFADAALGRVDAEEAVHLLGGQPMGDPGLRRAVLLIHAFHQQPLHDQVKRLLRQHLGVGAVHVARFSASIAPLVLAPFLTAKAPTLETARRMWAYGGPLLPEARRAWTPVTASTYADLVPEAIAGNDDAKTSLAVAGGVALLVDKAVSTVAVAGSGSGIDLPWQAHPPSIFRQLAYEKGPEGLHLLALAADTFRSDGLCVNSTTATRGAASAAITYLQPDVDLTAVDWIARRPDGSVVPLTETRVMTLARPTPTGPTQAAGGGTSAAPTPVSIDSLRLALASGAASQLRDWLHLERVARARGRAPLTDDMRNPLVVALTAVTTGVLNSEVEA